MIRYGLLAHAYGRERLRLRVMKSYTGFYLGTRDEDGIPFTRESEEYWATEDEAFKALENDSFTQKANL